MVYLYERARGVSTTGFLLVPLTMKTISLFLDFSRHCVGALLPNRWWKRINSNGYRFWGSAIFGSSFNPQRS